MSLKLSLQATSVSRYEVIHGCPYSVAGCWGLAQRARWKLWRDQGMDKWVTFTEGSEWFLRHADGNCGRLTSYCSCGQWLFELHQCLWDFTLIFSGCLRITTMNAHYLTGLKYSNALRSY